MNINIEALQLDKYPALNAFLQAESLADISTSLDVLISSPGSAGFPNYPYPLRIAFTRATLSIYEICAALGKIQHLEALLSRKGTPSREHRLDARPLQQEMIRRDGPFYNDLMTAKDAVSRFKHRVEARTEEEAIIHQNAEFYHDLMLEAVANNRIEMIDFLAIAHVANVQNPEKLRHSLRQATTSGHLAAVNKLITLAGDKIRLHDFANNLLGIALECGHLEVVNRLLESAEVKAALISDKNRLLIGAIRSRSLLIFNRYLEVVDLRDNVLTRGKELLGIAIANSCLDIVNRILEFKEIRHAMNERSDDLLDQALRMGNTDIINRLLELKGIRKALEEREDALLNMTIKSGRADIFNRLFLQAHHIAVSHTDPRQDLLCVAALLDKQFAVDTLLANKTELQLAKRNNFYRAFVGERLVLRAQELGINLGLKLPQSTAPSAATGEKIPPSAGLKRGRFFQTTAPTEEPRETNDALKRARQVLPS